MTSCSRLAGAALVAACIVSWPEYAAAVDSGYGDTPTCPAGQVYDQQQQKCVVKESGVDDNSLVAYAAVLSRNGRYAEALEVLDLMENAKTPKALNYRGYATRQLGRIEEGIGYYLESVALDPDYTLVREYLGEAYVLQGRIDLAKQQLAEIEKRCGTTCEAYQDLAEFIDEQQS